MHLTRRTTKVPSLTVFLSSGQTSGGGYIRNSGSRVNLRLVDDLDAGVAGNLPRHAPVAAPHNQHSLRRFLLWYGTPSEYTRISITDRTTDLTSAWTQCIVYVAKKHSSSRAQKQCKRYFPKVLRPLGVLLRRIHPEQQRVNLRATHRQCAEGEVCNHLLIRELVPLGGLDDAVQHQHLAKGLRLKHADVLQRIRLFPL